MIANGSFHWGTIGASEQSVSMFSSVSSRSCSSLASASRRLLQISVTSRRSMQPCTPHELVRCGRSSTERSMPRRFGMSSIQFMDTRLQVWGRGSSSGEQPFGFRPPIYASRVRPAVRSRLLRAAQKGGANYLCLFLNEPPCEKTFLLCAMASAAALSFLRPKMRDSTPRFFWG